MDNLEVIGSPRVQSSLETIPYSIDVTEWTAQSLVSATCVAYDTANGTDTNVSTTVLTGSPSVNGSIITLPLVHALTKGHSYRLWVTFTVTGSSAVYACFMDIKAI